MKSIFSLFITLFIGFPLLAQEQQSADASGFTGVNPTLHFGNIFLQNAFDGSYEDVRAQYKSIKGSPYLTKEPVKGKIVLNDRRVIEDINMHYDLHSENVIVQLENEEEELVLDKKECWKIMMQVEDEELILQKLNFENPHKFYVNLYQDEELIFFKDHYVTLREGSNQGLAKVNPKFIKRHKYYIKYGGQAIKSVKLKDKDVLSVFSERDRKKYKAYAKKNKIKLKKEKDFVKLFKAMRTTEEAK